MQIRLEYCTWQEEDLSRGSWEEGLELDKLRSTETFVNQRKTSELVRNMSKGWKLFVVLLLVQVSYIMREAEARNY